VQPPTDAGAVTRFRPWLRRVLGFSAGVAVVWVPLAVTASTGAAWPLLVSMAGLWGALVRAIRGSSAPVWGFLAGAVSVVAYNAIIWSQGSGCAYEDAAGRIVETDCGAHRTR
jgi:hypothetical protein